MELDAPALKLLDYLDRRVSAAVGDNAQTIARFLGLSIEQFQDAQEALRKHGLLRKEPLADTVHALRITDEGIQFLDKRRRL